MHDFQYTTLIFPVVLKTKSNHFYITKSLRFQSLNFSDLIIIKDFIIYVYTYYVNSAMHSLNFSLYSHSWKRSESLDLALLL